MFASLPSGAPLRRSVWRPVVRLSAAGEVGSTVSYQDPQPLFYKNSHFLWKTHNNKQYQRLIANPLQPTIQPNNIIIPRQPTTHTTSCASNSLIHQINQRLTQTNQTTQPESKQTSRKMIRKTGRGRSTSLLHDAPSLITHHSHALDAYISYYRDKAAWWGFNFKRVQDRINVTL